MSKYALLLLLGQYIYIYLLTCQMAYDHQGLFFMFSLFLVNIMSGEEEDGCSMFDVFIINAFTFTYHHF